MKVIALDFDGVLIINGRISPSAINNLNRLLEKEPDLKIVISSSWRHSGLKFCKDMLAINGFKKVENVIDVTDSVTQDDRGHHIERWIKDHKPEAFVIFDDHADMDKILDHLVKTNEFVGLTSDHIKKALDILKKPV